MYAETNEWAEAANAAELLTWALPNDPQPWLWRAEALKHLRSRGIEEAIELLAVAATRFPNEPIITFTNARYACELMRFREAHSWWMTTLATAKRLDAAKHWKIRALTEPDLQALWTCDLDSSV